ncbi:MAG: PAS domain S-box protein, partial [Magnetococcales bacterium]|nr:PAS domain S-box protein [Magnetococcales bacterium]
EREQYQETFRDQVARGGGFVANVQVINSRGERIPVEINAGVVEIDGGRVIHGIFRDVTERRNNEQALRWAMESLKESQGRLQGILDHSRAVITLKDPRGCYVLINRRFEELFGVREIDFLGHTDWDIFPEKLADEARAFDVMALENGPFEREECWLHPDGERTYIVVRFPIRDVRGVVTTLCVMSTEITERKQMEERLRQLNDSLEKRVDERTRELERSNRDLQQFAHVASHDLQEPLRQVSGFAQLLAKRYQGRLDEKADRFIDHMVEGTRHMQALIEGLLSLSRVNTHAEPLRGVPCEAVLEQVERNLATSIAQAGARVTHDPLPEVRADMLQLVRLFQNLIANAIKFRGATEPCVHVGVASVGDRWRFEVRDNGIGIESRHRERIFVIFQRLHARTDYPGTGIGLAICKRIVERHGGEIWVEEAEGGGSCFCFTLPKSKRRGVAPEAEAPR